jgi:signal transduction histidine kinase
VGLLAVDPALAPLYATVLIVTTLEWPFHIQLAEDMEIYPAAEWTSAAAAYILGIAFLPVFWLSATLGFFLIVALDSAGVVRASGIAADTVRLMRGQPHPPGLGVDGHLRGFVNVSTHAIRAAVVAGVRTVAPEAPLLLLVLGAEGAVALWLSVVPIPGRMAPRRRWQRLAEALGTDMLFATAALQVVIVYVLLEAFARGGTSAFVAASACTLVLHALVKRLNDTRIESERRRRELLQMRDELDRRHRLAVIGHTASAVFHQIARQHGSIGIFAHLLERDAAEPGTPGWLGRLREHVSGIRTSVDEANRVVDELLRFGQDRALNLYPQPLDALLGECVTECRPHAAQRGVSLEMLAGPDAMATVDKRKIKQAIGNVLDNAIQASPAGGRVEVQPVLDGAVVRIAVRDYGAGIPAAIRSQLFTPFCTSKADGAGLGLALARELVEAHGGEIGWRDAEPGTEFVVSLPLSSAETSPAPRLASGRGSSRSAT